MRSKQFFEFLEDDTDKHMIASFWVQMAQITTAT